MKENLKLTPTHQAYQLALHSHDAHPTIAYGSAGTGKTYGALQAAVKMLRDKAIKRIIITRPNVSFAQTNGFLPGTEREKMEPWVRPILQNLGKLGIAPGTIESWEKNGTLLFYPLEYVQGMSFDDAFIIVDECQNMTYEQLKVFLTRTGFNARVVLAGDIAQISPKFHNSGLAKVLDVIEKMQVPCSTIHFTREDIVRSVQCKMWIEAFEDYEAGIFPPDPEKVVGLYDD